MKPLLLIFTLLMSFSVQAQETAKIKVACIGNSITEGADIEPGKRYPDQLQKLLGDNYDVRNFGLGSRTLLKKGDASYWLEDKYMEALAWNPDIVIIKLGTNDSKPQNWIYSDEFETNYIEFINSFRQLTGNHKIYICTPIPVFREEWGISQGIVTDEMIPMIRKIAQTQKVKLIDLYTAMLDREELAPDGIHPNADGAAVIAEEVLKAIR
jgi:acyl-CoA thioesterase I